MKKVLAALAAVLLLAGCSAEELTPQPAVTVTVTAPAAEPANEPALAPKPRVVPDLVELYLSEALTGVGELSPRVFDATDGTEMNLDELWLRGPWGCPLSGSRACAGCLQPDHPPGGELLVGCGAHLGDYLLAVGEPALRADVFLVVVVGHAAASRSVSPPGAVLGKLYLPRASEMLPLTVVDA